MVFLKSGTSDIDLSEETDRELQIGKRWAPMPYVFYEFDSAHHCEPQAREILESVTTRYDLAAHGDIVALGLPVYRDPETGQTVFDDKYPFPEFMICANNRLTLGSDEDISQDKMARILRWVQICRANPDCVRGGIELAGKVCESALLDDVPCHSIIWYFPDFIAVNLWKPTVNYCGYGRSRIDGSTMPEKQFCDLCESKRLHGGVSAEVLFTQRNQ